MFERNGSANRDFNLLRYFTGASLTVILVASLASGAASAWIVRGVFLNLERDEADSLAEDLVSLLTEAGFSSERWRELDAAPELRTRILTEMTNFGITEFTLLDPRGEVLEDVVAPGANRTGVWPEGLADAGAGRVALRWETPHGWRAILGLVAPGGAVESYTPVREPRGVEVVARVRRDLSPAMLRAQGSLSILVVLTLAAGVAVFAALWMLVRRADATIRRQRAELEEAGVELHRRNVLLEELGRKKDEFYAMCSHDLRSPLLAIQAGCRLILADRACRLAPLHREYLEENVRRADGVLALVDDLLELARADAPSRSLEAETVELGGLLEAVIMTHRPLAQSAGVPLEVLVPEDEVSVLGDRGKLTRVAANLVTNAIKHAGGRPVTVHLARDADRAVIRVVDRGHGIPEERMQQIFDPYVAGVGGSNDAESAGTGLGLAIVREFVELHGGSVSVESSPGLGATFTVTLPSGRG